jgi:hypothetical protein
MGELVHYELKEKCPQCDSHLFTYLVAPTQGFYSFQPQTVFDRGFRRWHISCGNHVCGYNPGQQFKTIKDLHEGGYNVDPTKL